MVRPRRAPVPMEGGRSIRSFAGGEASSTGDDEIHGLRPLSFFIGLDIEVDALPFVERFQSSAFNRRDVNEHVASAIIRLDEPIAAFTIEELHRTGHGHRETPPRGCSAVGPHGATARLDIHRREKLRPTTASDIPPPPEGGGTSKPRGTVTYNLAP